MLRKRCSLELNEQEVRRTLRWLPRDSRLVFVRVPNEHGWVTRWFALLLWDEGQFVTVPVLSQSFLTTTGSNQTTNLGVDATWNNLLNAAECIGGGASGGVTTSSHATGGGGGAWCGLGSSLSLGANFQITTPGTTTFVWRVGTGGTAVTSNNVPVSGVDGTDTWLNGTVFPTSGTNNVGAKGGIHGAGVVSGTVNGGLGGNKANNWPTNTGNSGGRGGNLTGSSGSGGSGGGGAGGSTGAGNQGVDSAATTLVGTNGGSGDAGSGGALGTGATSGTAGAGGNGTEWDGSHGSGGGGGGVAETGGSSTTGGAAGNYGGGGGGSDSKSGLSTSGVGRQGIIALTWTPAVSIPMTDMAVFCMP